MRAFQARRWVGFTQGCGRATASLGLHPGLKSFRPFGTSECGFWLLHAESYLDRAPYSEAAAQLVFMAWLRRVINGGGIIERGTTFASAARAA